MSLLTDIRGRTSLRRGATLGIAVLLVLAASTPAVIGGVAADSASADTTIPDPLEEGYYSDQVIDGGETLTYDAELTDGADLLVVAESEAADDVTVSITDPSGQSVGESFGDDGYDGVEVEDAPVEGTYTVEITNTGERATFGLDVYIETAEESEPEPTTVPDPLETGYYGDIAIDAGQTLTYEAEVSTGDLFQALVSPETGTLDVQITGPDGAPIETDLSEPPVYGGIVVGAPAEGTYTVEITNTADTGTTFGLSALHESTVSLESDAVENRLESESFAYYVIDLAETDDLSVTIDGESVDAIEPTVFDPEIESAGDIDRNDTHHRIELSDVETDGTYLVQLYNAGPDTVNYDLEVTHEGPGATTPTDDTDGQTDDQPDDSNAGNDSSPENESDDSATEDEPDDDDGDGVPGMGATSALLALVASTMVAVSRYRSR